MQHQAQDLAPKVGVPGRFDHRGADVTILAREASQVGCEECNGAFQGRLRASTVRAYEIWGCGAVAAACSGQGPFRNEVPTHVM